MTLFVYINTAGHHQARESDLIEIDAAGFLVDMGSVLVDQCSNALVSTARPALQQVIRRINPGDTLVVARLGYLGNGVGDVVSTLSRLAAKRAHAICLDSGKNDLCVNGDDSPIRMLQLAAELERDAKRARALDAAAIAKQVGAPQGRPASLSALQRQQALSALAAGSTVTAVARVFSTSRQTIIRLRDASPRPMTTRDNVV
ncbi:transposon resolvase [Caballeronia sordidicola]|uniref:Transposon resolvase n=1 Tax=Caballeronia sordidicola TaxID=196367 RepID=A0A158GTJ6_CABSO|nr:recombinase family protein [Caballeronia sordidicola]SAL35405.1 transposon resolvase [Caballeronia sordidicola]